MPVPVKSSPVIGKRFLLRDVVRDQLRDAIMDGTFRTGEVLHDAELMEWLGVSRTPLREAINDLARMGLIEMEPNRYTRVVNPKSAERVAAFQTLGVLNSGAVGFGLPRLAPEFRRRVEKMAVDLSAGIRRRDLPAIQANFLPAFHLCAEQSGNTFLHRLTVEESYGLRYLTRVDLLEPLMDEDGWAHLQSAADSFVRALRDDDVSAARAATERMHLGWLRIE